MNLYDRHGRRMKRRTMPWESLRFWAFAGGVVGLWLSGLCCWPWLLETVKIVQAMWFR